MMFSEEDGIFAAKTARKVIENKLMSKPDPEIEFPEKYQKKMGVFVTLNRHPSGDLRGCIGYPEPVYKLKKGLIKAAKSATNDPRFPPLQKNELDDIIVEVTLLTPPEKVNYKDTNKLPKKIKCGRDGLIISKGLSKGLLLPQVPVENDWNEKEFLSHTCLKAGLKGEQWMEGDCKIEKFQGEIFKEKEPHGKVVRKEIG